MRTIISYIIGTAIAIIAISFYIVVALDLAYSAYEAVPWLIGLL